MECHGKKGKGKSKKKRSDQKCVPSSCQLAHLVFLPGGEEVAADCIVEDIVEGQGEKGRDQVDQESNSTAFVATFNLHVF